MPLSAYFPRIVTEWQREVPDKRSRVIEGSLVFMDISGFTAMSERLAKKGKIGAEEVTEVLDSSFASLLAAAYEEGGSLLKFGGDAMLLFFSGPQHAARACRAAIQMRNRLRKVGRFPTSAGMVHLKMSVGVHSGELHMFLLGSSHLELFVTGPMVTRTVEMEAAASTGQIRLSDATAAAIPSSCTKPSLDGGWLLVKAPPAAVGDGLAAPREREDEGAERFVSPAIRDHLLATSTRESEHRHAVVCFIHFEGVDELLARSGLEMVEQALSELVETVQQATVDFDLCFLATDIDRDGGKIIITGGVPKASGNDVEAVLRAVSQILASNQKLALRIGVNAGPVFAGDIGPPYRRTYTVMGDTVNLAARLMAKAKQGQALTLESVTRRARTSFEFEPLAPFAVKGKSKLITAVAIGAPRGVHGTAQEHLPLIGREQEIHLLLATIQAVADGGRASVNLVGEAGMGKSRIVEEVKLRAPHIVCHETSCEQYESSTAYFPIRRLLQSLMGTATGTEPAVLAERLAEWVQVTAPELQEWLPLIATLLDVNVGTTPAVDRLAPRFRRAQLHRVFAELLARAVPEPTLFVVEDAHWMDDASRELLADVFVNATERPWLFLATRRPGDAPLFSELDDAAVTIMLEALSLIASEELTAAAMGDVAVARHEVAALAERAGGNPLFLREMASALHSRSDLDDLPESVEALLTAQIDRLGGPERRVLRYASVVGPAFNVRLLDESLGTMMHGTAAEACRRLSDFVVEEGAESYRFRHALVREAAYNGLPFRLRLQLHERLGRSIERRHGRRADSRAELLSLHFHRARSYDKALHYSRIAGDRARAKSANIEAAAFYRRALDATRHLDEVPSADKAALYEALADVGELAAVYEEAARALGQARRHAVADHDRCRLLRKEGVVRERLGRYTQALRWYGRGLRYEASAEVTEIHQLQLAYAGIRFRQGRYADCVRWCLEVIPKAETADDRANLAHAYYLLDHAYTMLGSPVAGKYRERALPIFEELGDLVGQANVLNNLGVSASIEGDWDEALRLFERSKVARERVGDVVGAATATNNIGEVLLDRGHVEEAEPLFREALRTWRGANYAVGVAVATSALGLAATRSQRLEEARRLLEEALARFRDMGAESFVIETEARIAELHLVAGDEERAVTTIDATLMRSEAGDMGALTATLYRLRGFALMRKGRWGEARDAINESLRLARAISAQYELALSLQAYASLALAIGEDPKPFTDESTPVLRRLRVASIPLIDNA